MINKINKVIEKLENVELTSAQNKCYNQLIDVSEGLRNVGDDATYIALDVLEEVIGLTDVQKENYAKPIVKIIFDNVNAADHYLHWLCGQGEQDYWLWMEYREQEEDGDITATRFDYFNGTKTFAKDLTILARCSRLDKK